MKAQFRLVLQEDLAHELAKGTSLNAKVVPIEHSQGKPLRLGLEEATAAVAFLVALADLTKTCIEIADKIIHWMKERKQQRVTILIEGARNDALVEIDDAFDPAELAEKLQGVIKED